jgi:hypothetical protein
MFGLMDSQATCRDCGGRCLDGENICDECRSDRNGGRCVWEAGCERKGTHGGLCEEHATTLQQGMIDLWEATYCKHGTHRDYDCGQCIGEQDYEYYAEQDREQAAFLARLGPENLRAIEQMRLIEWRWQEHIWMQRGKGNWFIYGTQHDAHLVTTTRHVRTWDYPADLDDVPF